MRPVPQVCHPLASVSVLIPGPFHYSDRRLSLSWLLSEVAIVAGAAADGESLSRFDRLLPHR